MQKKYYTIPFKFDEIINRKESKLCDLKESIAFHIHLMNTTYFGECSFDDSFGSMIWELDFDNHKNVVKLKELVIESMYETMRKHEKRLVDVNVQVRIKQEELHYSNSPSSKIKKKIDITIKGKIKRTNENFKYNDFFYIGPLSY